MYNLCHENPHQHHGVDLRNSACRFRILAQLPANRTCSNSLTRLQFHPNLHRIRRNDVDTKLEREYALHRVARDLLNHGQLVGNDPIRDQPG
jgi:hypothetical protein